VIRHHRLIEAYLAEALGMPRDVVDSVMAELVGQRVVTPHGDGTVTPLSLLLDD